MNNFLRWSSGCACGLVAGIALAWTMTGNARDARPPQDRDALVALAQLVETEHRRVDLLVKAGDHAGAIRALEQLADGTWPSQARAGEAAVWMRHDVVGRLIRLELDQTEAVPTGFDALLARTERRLDDDGAPDAFAVVPGVVDWNGHAVESGDSAFGAAFKYRDSDWSRVEHYFASNEGWGIFQLELPFAVPAPCGTASVPRAAR